MKSYLHLLFQHAKTTEPATDKSPHRLHSEALHISAKDRVTHWCEKIFRT